MQKHIFKIIVIKCCVYIIFPKSVLEKSPLSQAQVKMSFLSWIFQIGIERKDSFQATKQLALLCGKANL